MWSALFCVLRPALICVNTWRKELCGTGSQCTTEFEVSSAALRTLLKSMATAVITLAVHNTGCWLTKLMQQVSYQQVSVDWPLHATGAAQVLILQESATATLSLL